ncbi:MAG: winged helix-turn-helix domain-containing protein [Spirochaetales bacterium]|nr:winged helix-turn-helix domain-containing protein [Spirochaetales bacterium]
MPVVRDICCVQLPVAVQFEIRDIYSDWYSRFHFLESLSSIPHSVSVIVIPYPLFLENYHELKNYRTLVFGSDQDLEGAFIAGADDFLKEPWGITELIIRVSRLSEAKKIQINGTEISFSSNFLRVDNRNIPFSPQENRIVAVLLENPNDYMSFRDLKKRLPPESELSEKSLYVHIYRIRSKLKKQLPHIYGKDFELNSANKRGYILTMPVDNLCKTVDKLYKSH